MKYHQGQEKILSLIAQGENLHQDFKFAISDARKIAKSLSAFANTEGGRLLIGVKDNGRIAGARLEEEIYMIGAAIELYCTPKIDVQYHTYTIEGKNILEVHIPESIHKPIYAIDEQKQKWAYVRVADENIIASPVHLQIWKNNIQNKQVIMAYTNVERNLLQILQQKGKLTLNQCCKYSRIERWRCIQLLANFIRFNLVDILFHEHTFYFKLKEVETEK